MAAGLLTLGLAACGGDDDGGGSGGSAGCVSNDIAEQFGATVPMSSFSETETLGFVTDLPVPADAAVQETMAEAGVERFVVFTTTSSRSELTPIYQTAYSRCDEVGRVSSDTSAPSAFQTETADVIIRVEYVDGLVTVIETPT